MTYADTAMKRDAVLQALPSRSEDALTIVELDARLGFSVRPMLESLYVWRRVERRLDETMKATRWLWWRL